MVMSSRVFESRLHTLLPELERVYKDIHAHPELSMQETRTAHIAAAHLRGAGYEVADGIGQTGVVGLLQNGDGPTVMLRADMDALPGREMSIRSSWRRPRWFDCRRSCHASSPLPKRRWSPSDATRRILDAFRTHFGSDRIREAKPTSASEDFGVFGTAWQSLSVFWFIRGTDPKTYAEAKQAGRVRRIPTNHNPGFAPVLHPTLETVFARLQSRDCHTIPVLDQGALIGLVTMDNVGEFLTIHAAARGTSDGGARLEDSRRHA